MNLLKLFQQRAPEGASQVEPPALPSPMKKFTRATQSISNTFRLVHDRLVETQNFIMLSRQTSKCPPPLTALLDRICKIEDILSRDHIKVAFVGGPSSGKSETINVLLRDKVLPTGIGHTTNCFCSVIGAEGEEGYVLSPDSQERQNVKNVKQLAHSLHKEHLDPNSLLQVFWPMTKCHLLKDDVELMDSPGIGMDPDTDQLINNHCLDADVFVLVSDAESTLMRAEKQFFHQVSERLSKPNVFILNNRWDCSAQEPEMMEEAKEQHLKIDIAFLCNHLKVVGEETAKNRVFFVSAKEALQVRTQGQQIPEGKGMPDGWKARFMEFESFEQLFKECVSSSAVRTKCERHHKQGPEILEDLESLLVKEKAKIQQSNDTVSAQLSDSWKRKRALQDQGSQLKKFGQQLICTTATAVKQEVAKAMRDIEGQLLSIVDGFKRVNFDPSHTATYKEGLCEWVDEKLNVASLETMQNVSVKALQKLIDKYQSILQLPGDELSRFQQLVRSPQFFYALKCSDLTENFKEDLDFHFSLGLGWVAKILNLSSCFDTVANLWSRFRGECVGVLGVGAAFFTMFSSQLLSPLSMCGGLFGCIYVCERLTWTEKSKEHAIKSQFVHHMMSKVSTQIRATSNMYTRQLTRNLGLLLEELNGSLKTCQQEEDDRVAQLTEEQVRLTQLGDKGEKLRNAVHLLRSDFEMFKEDYLDDG